MFNQSEWDEFFKFWVRLIIREFVCLFVCTSAQCGSLPPLWICRKRMHRNAEKAASELLAEQHRNASKNTNIYLKIYSWSTGWEAGMRRRSSCSRWSTVKGFQPVALLEVPLRCQLMLSQVPACLSEAPRKESVSWFWSQMRFSKVGWGVLPDCYVPSRFGDTSKRSVTIVWRFKRRPTILGTSDYF